MTKRQAGPCATLFRGSDGGGGGRKPARRSSYSTGSTRTLAALAAAALALAAVVALAEPWTGGEPAPPPWLQPQQQPHPIPALLPAAHATHPGMYAGACGNYPGGPGSNPSSSSGTIRSVRATSPNGAYFVGDTVDIRVRLTNGIDAHPNTQRDVKQTRLALETGDIDRFAGYVSHDSTFANGHVLYNYTVQTGDFSTDLDYNGTFALHFGTDHMTDDGSNWIDCRLTADTRSLADQSDIVVIGVPKTDAYVWPVTPDGAYGPGSNITVAVKFGEPAEYTGAVAPSLALNVSGTQRAAEFWTGNETDTFLFNYTVQSGDDTRELRYNGPDSLTGPRITNSTDSALDTTLPSFDTLAYVSDIDLYTMPQVLSVSSRNTTMVYGLGETLRIDVEFNTEVNATGRPTLALSTGQTNRSAAFESGSGTRTLVFNYTVGPGDRTGDLSHAGAGALSGAIADAQGILANTTLPVPAAGARLSASGPLVVDHAAPVLIPRSTADQGNGGFTELGFAKAVRALEIDGAQYLIVGGNSGAQSIRVHEDGTLSAAGSLNRAGSTVRLDTVEGIDVFRNSTGAAYAIAAESGRAALQTMHVHEDGSLGAVEPWVIGDYYGALTDVAAFTLGSDNHTYAMAIQLDEHIVQLVRLHENGTMEAIVTGPGRPVSHGPIGVDVFGTADGSARALVAENYGHRVNLYGVNETDVVHLGSANDSATDPALVLRAPWSVASFDLDGERHALVAGNDDGLQLLRVEDGSGLAVAGHARNGQGGFDALDNGRDIAVFTAGGATYGIVASETHSGIQLVRVAGGGGDGALVPAGSAFGSDPGFEDRGGYHGVDTFEMGGQTYAAVASGRFDFTLGIQGTVQVIQLSRASVVSVNSTTPDGTYAAGLTVSMYVNFNDNVTYSGDAPVLRLNVGGSARDAVYEDGNGTDTLAFNYTVRPGDSAADLAYLGVASLEGDIRGPSGRMANPTLPVPGSDASLSGSAEIALDGNGPRALSVSSPNATGPHGINKTIRVAVVFDENIVVNATLGEPTLEMNTGGSAAHAPAAQRQGSRTMMMLFDYKVAEGDMSERLDYAGGSALSLNGATVGDEHGNAWSPVLLPPPGENSLAGTSSVAVDGVRPAVESVSSPNEAGTYVIGDTIRIRVAFNETVDATGPITLKLDVGEDRRAELVPGSVAGDTLLFAYTVMENDTSADLGYDGRSALRFGSGGAIVDGAGNAANLTLPPAGSARSLAGTSAIVVNGTPGAPPSGGGGAGDGDDGGGDDGDMDGGTPGDGGNGGTPGDGGNGGTPGDGGNGGTPGDGGNGGTPGDGNVTAAEMCGATLGMSNIQFERVAAGSASGIEEQRIDRNGTLLLDEVSIRATEWTRTGGSGDGDFAMHANATQFRTGGAGAWAPLNNGTLVAVGDDGMSASVEFRLAVPADALRPGDAGPVDVSQTVTYTVSCKAPG